MGASMPQPPSSPRPVFRSLGHLVLGAAVLLGCAPSVPPTEAGVAAAPISEPGMWSPPASTRAAGDRQTVAVQHPPRIAPQGSCSDPNPWACSCTHPACGGVLPGTLEFARFLDRRFAQITSVGGFGCCRQNTGDTAYLSVHGIGRAIDLSLREVSSGVADNTAGDAVANWLVEHAQEIGVQLVVWDRAAWNPERPPGTRLNPYTGPIPHTDHIHVELNLDGANRRTPFFTSGASTGGAVCVARCEGDVIVNADCSTGDCSAFGVRCIADPAPRCVLPGCPRTGVGSICLDEAQILRCRDGLPEGAAGDCSAYGAFCSTAGVLPTEARCVSALCVGGPMAVPEAHEACSITPGTRLLCQDDGQFTTAECPAGQVCSMVGGTSHCEAPRPECPVGEPGPPFDDRTVCLSTGEVARCFEGNVVSSTECGTGGVCSLLGGAAHCAQAACLDAGGALREGEVCTVAGDIADCDGLGTFVEVRPCATGETCVEDASGVRCAPGTRPDGTGGQDVNQGAMEMNLDGGALGPGPDGGGRSAPLRGDCSCRAAGRGRGGAWAAAVVLALVGAWRRRRRGPRPAPRGSVWRATALVAPVALAVLGACAEPTAMGPDAAVSDAGPQDDAAVVDADAAVPDAAVPDAAVPDGGAATGFPSLVTSGHDVLYVGNSYVFTNDVPASHRVLAASLPAMPVRVEAVAFGGYTLAQHAMDARTDGTMLSRALRENPVDARAYDAVLLQEQSQIGGFPEGQAARVASLEASVSLARLATGNGSAIVLYETWGRARGDGMNPDLYPDFATMQDRLDEGYRGMEARLRAEGARVRLAPVGAAFRRVHAAASEGGADPLADGSAFLALYEGDGSHPSAQGAYLAACVLVGTITGASPLGHPDGPRVSPTDAERLRAVAAATLDDPAWQPVP